VLTYDLANNYPNPFNPSTTIHYALTNNGMVELFVYNTLGQKVATLVNQQQQAGRYSVNFNAAGLASGIYFYKFSTGDFSQIKKMLLLK
jgi:hypothetical protein